MAGSITLAIIKPDAFASGKAGKIIAHLEAQGFRVRAARVMHLTAAQAGEFYAVHKERPFFKSLTAFMTSGFSSIIGMHAPEVMNAVSDLKKGRSLCTA